MWEALRIQRGRGPRRRRGALADRHPGRGAGSAGPCSRSAYDNSKGTDLRPGRYTDLASLGADRVRRVRGPAGADIAELRGRSGEEARRAGLTTSALTRLGAPDRASSRGPAGLEAVTGPGVTITLSDASDATADQVIEDGEINPNRLVVHQQDIQAVVNAMWQGGAEAITLQGQRIVSTTGIKCEGNAVLIQGVPYPEPYIISAIGEPVPDRIGDRARQRHRQLPQRRRRPQHRRGLEPRVRRPARGAGVRRPARPQLRRTDRLSRPATRGRPVARAAGNPVSSGSGGRSVGSVGSVGRSVGST